MGVWDCLNRMAVFENLGRDLKPKGFTGGSGEHYRVSVGDLLPVMLLGVSQASGSRGFWFLFVVVKERWLVGLKSNWLWREAPVYVWY